MIDFTYHCRVISFWTSMAMTNIVTVHFFLSDLAKAVPLQLFFNRKRRHSHSHLLQTITIVVLKENILWYLISKENILRYLISKENILWYLVSKENILWYLITKVHFSLCCSADIRNGTFYFPFLKLNPLFSLNN